MEGGPGYQIGPGDILDISVWKDEALSRSVVVLPDGTISFPLVGKVEVAGRTVQQVREKMVQELSRYVPELELTIDVKQSNSMIVYVIGRVNAPGRQILNSNVTVLQALAMAGGLNPFANRNKIKIFRKEGDAKSVLTFRYNDVMDGNLETNVELRRGDVIVVP
ncbi:MAG: polysaccharide export protein [Geobacteraceae bacterium]|nr:polysaccharide export protein [Geobacteraceae bacterium]